jgi:hypothetical protein
MNIEFTPKQIARLTDYYHKRECKSSHTDQCGWEYENAPGFSGARYSHDAWARRVPELVARDLNNAREVWAIIIIADLESLGDEP